MIRKAIYPGICYRCGYQVFPGQEIYVVRGYASVCHTTCQSGQPNIQKECYGCGHITKDGEMPHLVGKQWWHTSCHEAEEAYVKKAREEFYGTR